MNLEKKEKFYDEKGLYNKMFRLLELQDGGKAEVKDPSC